MFEGGRYDLVFDLYGQLMRIQCKIARTRGGVVSIPGPNTRLSSA